MIKLHGLTSRAASVEEQCSEVSAVVDGIILQDEPEMAEIEGHMLHLSAVDRNVGPVTTFRFTGRRLFPAMGTFHF